MKIIKTDSWMILDYNNNIYINLNLRIFFSLIFSIKTISIKYKYITLTSEFLHQSKKNRKDLELDIFDYHWALQIISPKSKNYFKQWDIDFEFSDFPFIASLNYSFLSVNIQYITDTEILIKSEEEDYIILFLLLRLYVGQFSQFTFNIDGMIVDIKEEILFFSKMRGFKTMSYSTNIKQRGYFITPSFDKKNITKFH